VIGRIGRFAARAIAALVLVVLLYIAAGGLMSAVSGDPPARGRMVDIGGRKLRLVCEGPAGATPTVLFEAGAFGFAADWSVSQAKLAAQGVRSCAYDRAGMGFSDPGPQPRDGLAVTGDLEQLLAAAGETGPFVYVGHSMAGLYARIFAARNPDKVAGVVLVDAATPEAADLPNVRTFVGHFSTLSTFASWGAQAGLLGPLAHMFGDKIGVAPEAAAEKRWAFAHGPHNRTAAQEVEQWMATSDEAGRARPYPPHLPVAVVTAGDGRGDWKRVQAAPAKASLQGYVENVAAADHANLLGERYADAVVRGIDHVLRAAAASAQPAQ
jgi:pimeloyl-ACP methyl ester carboxylesterase